MYFIPKNVFIKRIFVALLICVGYVFAVWGFGAYSSMYKYYKPYYFKSSLFAFEYNFKSIGSFVLSPLQGTVTAQNLSHASSIPVLLYHGILNKTDGENVDLNTFTDQMFALKNAGYQTISIDDMYAFLAGKKELPAKSFLLTFDDGRKDSYYPADPILKALGFHAVMFTISKFAALDASNYYLTKDEIKSLASSDTWQIESHTRTHRNLATVPADELPSEIIGSKQDLEAEIGKPIVAFAFPFGELGQEETNQSDLNDKSNFKIMQMAQSTYEMSFFQFYTPKRFTQNYPDPADSANNYLVKRISVQPNWSGKDLLAVLSDGAGKMLPFYGSLSENDGWINTLWGNLLFSNNHMIVQSLASTTGSAILLDGSRLWTDYTFAAHVLSDSGSNMYLWARYQDDNNYVACNFGDTLVHVEQTINGQTQVIKGSNITLPPNFKQDGFTAAIRVNGRDVTCSINDQTVVETPYLDPTLISGGVGIKVWDPTQGLSAITVDKVSVTLPQ